MYIESSFSQRHPLFSRLQRRLFRLLLTSGYCQIPNLKVFAKHKGWILHQWTYLSSVNPSTDKDQVYQLL